MLFDTEKMKSLYEKFRPYLNQHLQLPDDAPAEIKEAFAEYKKLGEEQIEFAYNL